MSIDAAMEYKIEIVETSSKFVKVEAESFPNALAQVKSDYEKERIVIDWSDFVAVQFKAADDDQCFIQVER